MGRNVGSPTVRRVSPLYPLEIHLEAVRLARDSGVGEGCGSHGGLLEPRPRSWVLHPERDGSTRHDGLTPDEKSEVAQLRWLVRVLERE